MHRHTICILLCPIYREILCLYVLLKCVTETRNTVFFFCNVYMKVMCFFFLVPFITQAEFSSHDMLLCHFWYSVDTKISLKIVCILTLSCCDVTTLVAIALP